MRKTEFFETAVQHGFYGKDRSGLYGKKDNVRKYWEDISIKISIRPIIEQILKNKEKIRIIDLGCGSGEGIELLTHIPPANPVETGKNDFVINKKNIECYKGVDISPSMVEQGKKNYPDLPHIQFIQTDLSHGFSFQKDLPYDIYFSSYGSLSHLTFPELEQLTLQIFSHVENCGFMVFDLYGRYSPEWPIHWEKSCHDSLPYNMAYLLPPEEQDPERIEWFEVTYWNDRELIQLIESASIAANRKAKIVALQDRSILVGRHMDTCLFKKERHQMRRHVNRLFDRDYRGRVNCLNLDITYLEDVKGLNSDAWTRISNYYNQWQTVITMLQSLMINNDEEVKSIIESSSGNITDELKMLTWLYRNADRFPVVDFWASVMGPQVACVLRNLELGLPQGLGCGHGLFCIVEIENN
jgi:SAM-dependent methyltransferase